MYNSVVSKTVESAHHALLLLLHIHYLCIYTNNTWLVSVYLHKNASLQGKRKRSLSWTRWDKLLQKTLPS